MPSRPLVVRCGAFGDLVQLTALLEALERASPEPCDLVVGHPGGRELLAARPRAGEIGLLTGRRTPYILSPEQRRLVRWLRARRPSPALLIETVASAQPKMRRLMERGGIGGDDLVDSARLTPRGPLEHGLDYLSRIAEAAFDRMGAPRDALAGDFLPRLDVPDSELDTVREWLEEQGVGAAPPIVVHASSRRTNRGRWPSERWSRLLAELARRRPEATVLVSGIASEREEVEALVASAGEPRVVSAAGDLPALRLAALLAVADSFVGLDSGPGHVAAAVGCPATLLFGMADPRRVAPRGEAPVELVAGLPRERWPDDPWTWQRENRMEAIALDDVLAAWERAGSRADPRG